MNTDLTTQLLALRSMTTEHAVGIAVLKKQHEVDMSLIQMLDQAARAAPPPGQGTKVDKLA